MMRRCLFTTLTIVITTVSFSQETWDLVRCVEYALKNNISVQRADLQSRFSAIGYVQDKAGRLPTLNFNGSIGYRFGRSENPTTGVLEDNNFLNSGVQLQSQVTLFNWFAKKNTQESSRLTWEADKQQTLKVQNDIALNVAVAYLNILLAKEEVKLAKIQVEQTLSNLSNTRAKVNAGILPELNASNIEGQLAMDSSALITAQANVQRQLLLMKALLNLDAGAPFDLLTPPVDNIPLESLADLQPEAVYTISLASMPQQKVNELRILSAKKASEAAKGNMYPTISAFGNLNTNYVNIKVPERAVGPNLPTGAIVTVGGTDYDVFAPSFIFVGEKAIPIGTQFRNNFGQSVGIGLSVPIFNGRSLRSAWDRSKLTVVQLEMDKKEADRQLKQDIYTAYTDATAALQKYNADKKAVAAAEKTYDFAKKRYDVALLATFDLLTTQNNLQTARVRALYSQYDYVFKMKLLEFYKGQGLKL